MKRGTCISIMVTTTTTITTSSGAFVSCAAESDIAKVFNFADLYTAWRQCRQHKRRSKAAQLYETRLLDNLYDTLYRLNTRCYQPTTSICFVTRKPKAREIHAAAFADRVIHHWLVPRLNALYEPVFIHDLYSNRVGKGTHKAVLRLQYFMRCLQSQGLGAYYLQLDIHNFFNQIDRAILFRQVQKRLSKSYHHQGLTLDHAHALRWLSHVLLKDNTAIKAQQIGSAAEFALVPAHKRLIYAGAHKGLPIGNLTSQFFANVYLNELDQLIKHRLKCRYYLRYVDDFILLHHDPQQLQQWQQAIITFLAEHLALRLKQVQTPQPIDHGADFLGYIVRPHYCLVRRRVVGNLREKLRHTEKIIWRGNPQQGYRLRLYRQAREQVYATLNSYLGHFSHARHYHLLNTLWLEFPWLSLLFVREQQPGRTIARPLWEPLSIPSYQRQVAYFKGCFPYADLRVQRGRETDYFPAPHVPDFHCPPNIWQQQVQQAHIQEAGYLKNGLKRRLFTLLYVRPSY